jgi:hypothetical protein
VFGTGEEIIETSSELRSNVLVKQKLHSLTTNIRCSRSAA